MEMLTVLFLPRLYQYLLYGSLTIFDDPLESAVEKKQLLS